MDVVARVSKEWRRRMLFMFFLIFGIAAWFFYDGYILWPDEAHRHIEYLAVSYTHLPSPRDMRRSRMPSSA